MIPVFFLFTLSLAGCIETQEIEELGLINAQGVDLTEDNLLETTSVIFQFAAQTEDITKVISGHGKTIQGAMEDTEHASVFKLAPGKIKLTLYGREMGEKGILPLLDTEARDARVPDLMYLAVSNTSAKEILSINEKKLSMNIGEFLRELIENHSRDHNVPRKTIQDFLRIYYDVGQDNVLPLFELKEEIPKLNAIAVFKGDKLVGQISNREGILINLMDRTVKEQMLEVSLPIEPFEEDLEKGEGQNTEKKANITFLIKKGNSKTKLIDKENLIFQTETDLELRLLEQSAGIVLKDEHIIKLLENEMEKEVEARFEKLLTKLQKLEADSFGYGRYYKSSKEGKNLTREEWQSKFPEIDVKFKVNAEIIRHGVKE